jgi:hypothetical protein
MNFVTVLTTGDWAIALLIALMALTLGWFYVRYKIRQGVRWARDKFNKKG